MSAISFRPWSPHILIQQSMMLCIVLLAVSCTNGDSSWDAPLPESAHSTESFQYGFANGGYSGVQGYTEEEIGIEYLVDEYFADRGLMSLTRYRTDEEYLEADATDNFQSLSTEARDRAFFEQAVRFLFFAAGEAMPPEVRSADDALYDAFYDSLDLCAERSRWPEVELYRLEDGGYLPVWSPQLEADRLEVSLDEYLDFRYECNKFAASYPALDREYRDELLRTRRDYYLEVLRLWMRDNPEMVVPMTYEQSVNHPYQDYVREICRSADDPQECASSEGVTLE